MAKFTRTAYASGSLRMLATDIAAQAFLNANDLEAYYSALHPRRAAGRKRVRITILVEPEAPPPKRAKSPRRPVPVQQVLDLSNVTPEGIRTHLERKGTILHHMLQASAGGSTP
jgi:hypothetical protein